MSTDILKFPSDSGKPKRTFSAEALGWYLGVTIPIMIVTFLASYKFRSFEKKRAGLERMKYGDDLESSPST